MAGLRAVVPPGGRYFLLCFSDRPPGLSGPRRITQDEIRAAFADGWRVDSIEPAMIDSTFQHAAARAWLATIPAPEHPPPGPSGRQGDLPP